MGCVPPCPLSRENRGVALAGTQHYSLSSNVRSRLVVSHYYYCNYPSSTYHPLTNITMLYQETDPLLPQNSPAPEIQGSRAQSINEVANRNTLSPDAGSTSKPRFGLGDIYRLLFGLIILAFFAILIFPHGFKDVLGDGPQTIDERVNSILTRTPLIGCLPFLCSWAPIKLMRPKMAITISQF